MVPAPRLAFCGMLIWVVFCPWGGIGDGPMSKKKDPILVALGESPEKWDAFFLKQYGFPAVPQPRYEVSESSFVSGETGQTVPLEEIAGSRLAGSHTQRTDELLSLHQEAAVDENTALSAEWVRYLEYMDIIAEALSPNDKGAALKQMALEGARSRYWEQPPDVLSPMNASLGTPAEFRQRWIYGELEIRAHAGNRRHHVIEIWRLPPDEPEELDEAGEPSGHWDGLKWTPTPTES